eukprot:CAMPEP_0175146016 /NCGR_PEP_ID=MMETSP0087-20121206/15123_1 /TAXON_ID=136419 /ORGANISM="Unknown Unknown, Strain D1" /LENGTH=566 /DNA_ID=CAMNT_0016430889 /DNA_START=20 /DNA_END=1720 /DNA_ORIENTATION=-
MKSVRNGTYEGDYKKIRTASGEEILVRHGYGIASYPNSYFKYVGNWVDGEKHGEGEFTMGDSVYKGSFVNGEIEGYGLKKWADGNSYSGQFHKGEMSGQGMFLGVDGTKYEGGMRANKRDGEGELDNPDGSTYRGSFYRHKRHGEGTFVWPDGTEYNGEWDNDMQHNAGLLSMSNGDVYDGDFKANLPDGLGVFSSISTGLQYDGSWGAGFPKDMCRAMLVRTKAPLAEEVTTDKKKKDKKKDKKKTKGEESEIPVITGPPRTTTQTLQYNGQEVVFADGKNVFKNEALDSEDPPPDDGSPIYDHNGSLTLEVGQYLPTIAICLADELGKPLLAESGRQVRVRIVAAPLKVAVEAPKAGKGKGAPPPETDTSPVKGPALGSDVFFCSCPPKDTDLPRDLDQIFSETEPPLKCCSGGCFDPEESEGTPKYEVVKEVVNGVVIIDDLAIGAGCTIGTRAEIIVTDITHALGPLDVLDDFNLNLPEKKDTEISGGEDAKVAPVEEEEDEETARKRREQLEFNEKMLRVAPTEIFGMKSVEFSRMATIKLKATIVEASAAKVKKSKGKKK